MVAYADSSALLKLAHREAESEALVAWLELQPNLVLISSALAEVEVYRALHRHDPAALPQLPIVLARVVTIAIGATVRAIAGAYQYPLLRSLDAIHLASARVVAAEGTAIDAFVAYDARLLGWAREEGLPAISPGAAL
ncbi:MAG: type II toxin-antitoxin system VapC family toxin [Chloroflexota bacterium]